MAGRVRELPDSARTAKQAAEAIGVEAGQIVKSLLFAMSERETVLVLVDRSLLRFDQAWAAGGTPHTVFPLTPDELVRITEGRVADVIR